MNFQNDPENQDEAQNSLSPLMSQLGMNPGMDFIGKALGLQNNSGFNAVKSSLNFGIIPTLTNNKGK